MSQFRVFLLALFVALPGVAFAERVCDEKLGQVCIETVQSGGEITFLAENRHARLPVTLNIEVSATNLRRVKGGAGPFVLQGKTKVELFTLAQHRNAAWSYRYDFTWSRGDITARHDDSVAYRLPFAPGAAFNVGQSCNGAFSHRGAVRYAVDIDMPIGTPIHAARAGTVVEVKEDSRRGGAGSKYRDDGNHIIIQHSDRTLGQYFHLKHGGAAVRIGQSVRAGTLIGYSGNTGQSTGPHLHFDVVKGSRGVESATLPFRFATSGGAMQCPPKGTVLR